MPILLCAALASTMAVAHAPGPTPTTTPVASEQRPIWRRVGGFVGVDWRVLGLAGHVSHGPGFQAGVILFDHLAIGIAGVARPGPINPATFTYDLPAGQSYKGKSRLHLRSDGNTIGLLVAPFFDLRRVPLSIELPLMVGYGGFGFYLHGEDREVPDGRRVSAWENELLGGRDSDASNLAIEVGVRLAWTPRAAPYVRPYLGVHHTWIPGFSTAVRSNYDGFSGVLGIKFGRFPR